MTYERESGVEDRLVEKVKALGLAIRKLKWEGRKNAPDRVILLPGARMIYIETKAPTGTPNSGQVREHRRLRDLGFQVEVLYTKDQVDRFVATLESKGHGPCGR